MLVLYVPLRVLYNGKKIIEFIFIYCYTLPDGKTDTHLLLCHSILMYIMKENMAYTDQLDFLK